MSYIVLAGSWFYPKGFEDFVGCFEDLDSAKSLVESLIKKSEADWGEVLETDTQLLHRLDRSNKYLEEKIELGNWEVSNL